MLNGDGNKSGGKISTLCCCFVSFSSPEVQVAIWPQLFKSWIALSTR